MRSLASALIAIAVSTAAQAKEAPRFEFPVACALGETCWIYQYPDLDPGPGWRDYRGGKMSYDGHKGTDIGLEDIDDIETGIPVLAAADGRVYRLRDGVADRAVTPETRDAVSKTGCGNAVLLDHGAGWTSIYCHLKQGSVLVREGQRVSTGDPLGLVGLSGLTEFPHLEFQVRKDNQPVDPTRDGLWATGEVRAAYGPVLLHVGFAKAAPDQARIIAGDYEPPSLAQDSGDFLFYATLLGAAPDQRLSLTLLGPDGGVEASSTVTIDRAQILRTNWVGVRDIRRLPPGSYRGVALLRLPDGAEHRRETDVVLRR